MSKVLFILKYRENPDSDTGYSCGSLSSGLANSARYVCDMLNHMGVRAVIEHAEDNNCIDRLVTQHRPTHVIIEAFWVVPEKFEVLTNLHPGVRWIVRNHSELPFLASEGIAIDWICKYVAYPNVYVAGNSPRVLEEMRAMVAATYPNWDHKKVNYKVWYLPNYYEFEIEPRNGWISGKGDHIDIGCFGAIRPLKNQLLQAVAAIRFGDSVGKKIRFHVNGTRIEGKADAALKNLRALFANASASGHELIEHTWMDHDTFIEFLKDTIDIGMCVSHSETFCIVAADLTSAGVPTLCSPEIPWATELCKCDPNDSEEIARKLKILYRIRKIEPISWLNRIGLMHYCKETRLVWGNHFC